MHLARKGEPIRGKLKSPQTPKSEKSLQRFGPIRLLCKHVTNLLKPATNCLCTPYKLGNSLGSALWPCTTPLVAAGALIRVSKKLPFFCVLHCLGSLLSSSSGIRTSGIIVCFLDHVATTAQVSNGLLQGRGSGCSRSGSHSITHHRATEQTTHKLQNNYTNEILTLLRKF